MNHKANTLRALAAQYPPAWQVPPDMRYHPSEHDLAALFDVGVSPDAQTVLRLERERILRRIEAIEDGSHYARPSFLPGQWWTDGPDGLPPPGSTYSRSGHDRSEAYHLLWWIDVLMRVHEVAP